MDKLYWILAAYLVGINIVTYYVYRVDKMHARRHEWRISEHTLLLLAFVGGACGALVAMQSLRHKTKHLNFMIMVPLFLAVQVIAVGFVLIKFGGIL